ncbi:hypothetical protein AVEN_66038-1 [Araneus ventricosus]|uniref:DDE-1 domain-containing protein n=1 Tax=Araneus ventricosus TaxID=182803 RepID=A0A4Y2JXJ7_ARAVE|nr:hypothetical protein AVEN_66038-1 [Araneus ventricosus]
MNEYPEEEDIIRLEWLAFSPDLNPIEHNGSCSDDGLTISKEKLKFLNYFEYIQSIEQEIAEDDAFEVLNCDDKGPTECQLTDAEICSMVLMNSQTSVSDSEESEEETQVEDKIPIDSLVEVLNTAIKGPEQRDFIKNLNLKLLNKKPKLMKQLTLN